MQRAETLASSGNGWLASAAVHLVLLMIFPLLTVPSPPTRPMLLVAGGQAEAGRYFGGQVQLSDFGEQSDQLGPPGVAADDALRWLIGLQQPSGGWAASSLRLAHVNTAQADVETTALVLLAFSKQGMTHRHGDFAPMVDDAKNFLLQNTTPHTATSPDRLVFNTRCDQSRAQALATLALCELYARTRDPLLAEPAQEAINQIVATQSLTSGDWRTTDGKPVTNEVAAWNVLAMQEAFRGQLIVPSANIMSASKWFSQQHKMQSQQSADVVDPCLLLPRLNMGIIPDPICQSQLDQLLAETTSQRTLPADYFATLAVAEFSRDPRVVSWMARQRSAAADPAAWRERELAGEVDHADIQQTALRLLIWSVRERQFMLTPEEDFPL